MRKCFEIGAITAFSPIIIFSPSFSIVFPWIFFFSHFLYSIFKNFIYNDAFAQKCFFVVFPFFLIRFDLNTYKHLVAFQLSQALYLLYYNPKEKDMALPSTKNSLYEMISSNNMMVFMTFRFILEFYLLYNWLYQEH